MWSFYRQFKDYFNITKGESVAILLLLFISIIIGVWPYRYPVEHPENFSALLALVDSAKNLQTQESSNIPVNFNGRFNPNTVELNQLIALGFEKKIAYRIIGYRTKIKPFKYKEDLFKIYGIDSNLVLKLFNQIELSQAPPQSNQFHKTEIEPTGQAPVRLIEINSADSAQLESLPCIGAKLARRLLIFRNKLGGFHQVQQLKEVYGIDTNCLDDIYKKITLNVDLILKLKINKLDASQLSVHPYIGKFLASAIVAYRQQHGNFSEARDLLKIKILDERKLQKLLPYLDFQF